VIIRSLRLENYRKHKNTYVEFPDGLFGIVGNNGAGKTTLIEAIAYAIYGQHASKTGQNLIKREQASGDSDCKVELEFHLGSDSYRIIRELRGSRQSPFASLYVNNRCEVEGVNPVTRYLSKKIGMDYKSFFTSIFAKQKELDALSNLGPQERSKRILRLLGVDRIDVAIGNLRQNKREKESTIRGIKNTLADIGELNSALEELQKQKGSYEHKVESEKIELEKAKTILDNTTKSKENLEIKYTEYQRLDKLASNCITQKDSYELNLESRNKELENLEKAKQELQIIKPKLKLFKSIKTKKENLDKIREVYLKKNNYDSQMRDIDVNIKEMRANRNEIITTLKQTSNLETKLQTVKKTISNYTKSYTEIGKKIASKKAIISQFKQERRDSMKDFDSIKKLGPKSKCPVCKKTIGKEFSDIVKHFTNEASKTNKKIQTAEAVIDKLSKESQKIQRLMTSTQKDEESISKLIRQRIKDNQSKNGIDEQIRSELQKKKRLLQNIKALGKINYKETIHGKIKKQFEELSSLDKTRISLETRSTQIPDIKNIIASLQNKKTSVVGEIEKISKSIKDLNFNLLEYEKTKSVHSTAIQNHHEVEMNMVNTKNTLSNIERDITTTTNQISQENERLKQIEDEEKNVQLLQALDKIFGDFRIDLVSRIRPMLSLRASDLFRKLTDGKYANIIIDENYDILIEDDGKQFPLERFSGGEEDLASLCLRIAISQVIEERAGASSINFIALDEVFGSQDESRRNNILKALNDLSSQFRQVMVITHTDDVKDLLPYVFNVLGTEDKSCRVVSEGSPSLSLVGIG